MNRPISTISPSWLITASSICMRSHAADDLNTPAGWTHDAVQIHRIGVQPRSIAVGTDRSDVVETMLLFHPAAPANDFGDAEHVVEADIEVPNGDLTIYSPADDPGQERQTIKPECHPPPEPDLSPGS